MPPKTVSKVVREMWNNSYQVDLALRPTEYGAYSSVKSAACRFCEVYGREQDVDDAVVEEVILPLLTLEETRERKRRKKTTKTQHWTKFRVDNIQKHHREQHATKWATYKILLEKKHTEPEKLTLFFEQSRLEAFFQNVCDS